MFACKIFLDEYALFFKMVHNFFSVFVHRGHKVCKAGTMDNYLYRTSAVGHKDHKARMVPWGKVGMQRLVCN